MEIIKKLTFVRIKRKMLPSKGRRQHFYDRAFFDSADSVHHVVEPIAIEMNVDIVGDACFLDIDLPPLFVCHFSILNQPCKTDSNSIAFVIRLEGCSSDKVLQVCCDLEFVGLARI